MKLTLRPAKMRETDVQRLREVGFEDGQILVAVQVIGYFNYINRLADALGVEPEAWMDLPYEQWRSQKGDDWWGVLGDEGA